MKSIALIIPYFGKFPTFFNLFLETCKVNSSVDWYIFTDSQYADCYPKNVHFVFKTFEDIRKLFQSRFDFEISLEKPYKLCDYKPAYGYIFHEYVKDYDFWGYCDMDVLFGNLRKFLTEKVLESYDKIGHLGHFTIYKNTHNVNNTFMCMIDGRERYKEVFKTNRICVFDEWEYPSINDIFIENKFNIFFWNSYFDIYPYDDQFKRVFTLIEGKNYEYRINGIEKSPSIAIIENGDAFFLKKIRHHMIKEEVAYIHFQKRNMEIDSDINVNYILCLPDKFLNHALESSVLDKKILKRKMINKKRIRFWYGEKKYWLIEKSGPLRHKIRLFSIIESWVKNRK